MKKILISLFLIITILSWVGLVFWGYINFTKKISFNSTSWKNIFSDIQWLKYVVVSFTSNRDISDAIIQTHCKSETSFITQEENTYFFKFILLDQLCQNPNFSLKQWEEIFVNTNFILTLEKKVDVYSLILDYSSQDIVKTQVALSEKIKQYSQYKELKETPWTSFMSQLKNQRFYNQLVYKESILEEVINKRQEKYSIPVKWYKISDELSVIPNADRNYRKEYTDWIHHWWDIMAPLWTPVSAIDDWIIIRVVRGFEYADISNIKQTGLLTHSDKLRNLDILRWNQIWLKTMKWDVIFYSHLNTIYDNIEEWVILKQWTDLWTIWVTWVPDRNYSNFHLHFPIQKNPYDIKKAWKYSLEDIMDWDWYLKWLDATSVIEWKDDIFELHDH